MVQLASSPSRPRLVRPRVLRQVALYDHFVQLVHLCPSSQVNRLIAK